MDGDGVANQIDNCQLTINEGQMDMDRDGQGDACEPAAEQDSDQDGVGDACEPAPAGQAPPAGQPTDADACGCDGGTGGMMAMPMTLLGLGWMRRRRPRVRR